MATKTPSAESIRKQFEAAGFTVSEAQPRSIAVKKSGYEVALKSGLDHWVYAGPPWFLVNGARYELEDRGYQKFWYSKSDGKRVPIRKIEIANLHRFDEEVRYLLGLPPLYNQSLGSVNARTVYDRLEGRPDR